MNQRIVAISGPLKGSVLSIMEPGLIIGSDLDLVDVCLEEDERVADEHCYLWMLEDGRTLLANESEEHPTLVNGEEAWDQLLTHGDSLQIGSSTFIYYEEYEPAPAPARGPLRFDSNPMLLANNEQEHANLIEVVFDYTEAERVAVLLLGRGGDDFAAGTYAERNGDETSTFPMNRTVVELAVNDRLPILRNDTQSVICVPLVVAGNVVGVIYAHHSERNSLDNSDLRRLADMAETAADNLSRSLYVQWLENENERLKEANTVKHDLIGDSAEMREVYRRIGKVGPVDSTVLIHGETGTGKELVARAIHQNSRRAKNPFVAVNCAAIAPTLMESELFGHEKGSFTSAVSQKKGLIESADGGTLFFDEIGELPFSAQAALLRVLQEHEFMRVGGTRPIKVNVRIIAATHRDLAQLVKEGHFRQDLYYRLKVFSITIRSLAARREDIHGLVSHFIRKLSHIRKVKGIDRETRRLLMSYDWPGNVRELEHVIEHALLSGDADWIRPEDLPQELRADKPHPAAKRPTLRERLDATTKHAAKHELELSNGNYDEAAAALDIHPTYLYKLTHKFNLRS